MAVEYIKSFYPELGENLELPEENISDINDSFSLYYKYLTVLGVEYKEVNHFARKCAIIDDSK